VVGSVGDIVSSSVGDVVVVGDSVGDIVGGSGIISILYTRTNPAVALTVLLSVAPTRNIKPFPDILNEEPNSSSAFSVVISCPTFEYFFELVSHVKVRT
jgi:hypothetical protein